MNEIKAKEGYYLSDNDKTTFYKSVKGANVSEDDYIQVEETEAQAIIKHNDTIRDMNTLEVIDDIAYKSGSIAECMNVVPMTNKEAVERTTLFPKWEDYIGKSLSEVGFRIQYNKKMYEILQPVPSVIANQTPDLVPANYGLVSEHAGTIDDPIPYEHWLVIKKDKYYTENGKLYIGLIDAPNGYDVDLAQLPTIAKEVTD